jgi:hypothetical protein
LGNGRRILDVRLHRIGGVRVRTIIGLLVLGLSITACSFTVGVNCGPLDPDQCEGRASEIVSVVEQNNPGRRVVSIEFLNAEGHARVVLDDDTEVGWGERL